MRLLLMLALVATVATDCPRHCECKWRSGKESAVCSRAGLTAVPTLLEPTTQLLDLSENRLTILRDGIFSTTGLLNLQRLYLSACNIRTIRPFTFQDLVNLVELDLSKNRLDSIPTHAFESIPELRELRLSGNPITKIKDESFMPLSNLVRLSLSYCKISEIEPRGFVGIEGSLEYLELDKNKLQILHVAVIAPLRSLKGLELASNLWDCTCALRPLRDWMIRHNVPATMAPECALPPRLMGQSWDRLDLDDFACEPEVSAASSQFVGVAGDEVTLICNVRGVPAPRVRWMRAGRLIANGTTNVNSQRAFILRSEGQSSYLTIKVADMQDAGSYLCNAENRAGKSEVPVNLVVVKRTQSTVFGGRAVLAGTAVSAVIVLVTCIIGLCVIEARKKRQLDRWREQIVTSNHRDDSYEKIVATAKCNIELPRNNLTLESNRKRGNYQNVPSHDPEEDYETYQRRELRELQNYRPSLGQANWNRIEMQSVNDRSCIERDLHIPRFNDDTLRMDATPESMQSSNSASVSNAHVEILSETRFNNNPRLLPRPTRDRLDNDLSGSDSEKNYPDLIEMSALGTSSYLRSEIKHHPYNFSTMPRRKDADSRSPLLNSRRNSSGGDSVTSFERSANLNAQRGAGRRSNSFLDLSVRGSRSHRNPSLPASPSKEYVAAPSATPLLDLSGLRQYSLTSPLIDDFDFRASQLEKFLAEYRSLREQLSKVKETRESLQRSRVVGSEESRTNCKGNTRIAVTSSSSTALADAASPLNLGATDYRIQPQPEWLKSLLYRN